MNDSIQMILLKQKIESLETKIDSISTQSTLKQLEFKLNESQNIISHVNDFYDSAWLKLVIVISVLGIAIPILAQYFQRRNLRDLTDFIQAQLNEGFKLKLSELKEFNKMEIMNSVKSLSQDLESIKQKNKIILTEMDTSTFFLQGRTFMTDKDYPRAISSFLRSSYFALQSDRTERVTAPFVNALNCFKRINDKETLDRTNKFLLKSTWSVSVEEALKYFDEHEEVNRYKQQLNAIRNEITRINQIGN